MAPHDSTPKPGWEMLCEHANEVPNICPCPPTCGCRSFHCGTKTIPPRKQLLSASALRDLAQYLLAAAIQHERGQLTPQAISLLREWTLANDYVKALTGEFASSHTATVTKRAIGMLHADQAAKDVASAEVQATLSMDEQLKEELADGNWEAAGDMLSAVAIAAYLSALTRRQS